MELYEHQIKVLNETENRNRVAYYMDMGLGKTFVGSEKMARLRADYNLVICQKSKVKDWKEHFMKYYPMMYIYNLTDKKSFETFCNDLKTGYYKPMVGIVNYELAWRRQELLKLKDFTLMLDESSLIQNRKAKQTKFILKLNPKNVILLSGTPCSGKYENLWTQMHLLGWEITEKLYETQYVNWKLINGIGGHKIKVVDTKNPYKNVDRLKSKLKAFGAVFMKTSSVIKLPSQNIVDVHVNESQAYIKFMKNSIVELNGEILVGDTNLTKRLYARMICGTFNKRKLEAFKDLLESTNERLIVFYNFTKELDLLTEIATKLNKSISVVNGKTKDLTAYEEDENSVTFVQYQAGAKGLNLQKANRIIYFTPTEKCEDYMQSMKRIHRIGQTKPCYYYRMMSGIEYKIYDALERGENYTDELFRKETK